MSKFQSLGHIHASLTYSGPHGKDDKKAILWALQEVLRRYVSTSGRQRGRHGRFCPLLFLPLEDQYPLHIIPCQQEGAILNDIELLPPHSPSSVFHSPDLGLSPQISPITQSIIQRRCDVT